MSPLARFKLFRPILPGATLGQRLRASAGAFAGIGLTGLACALLAAQGPHGLWLVPPMGASAVLLFVVPSSPMSQPWPVVGGNAISALVGFTVGHVVGEPALAAGLAVGLAIAAMSLLRCLHPPGGAAALVGLFAAPSASLLFPLAPVGLNALLLVACAFAYHRLAGNPYPHRAAPPAVPPVETESRPSFNAQDVDAALDELGETFDITRDDLERLLRAIEKRALARAYHDLACRDLMTRDVISVGAEASRQVVAALLASHDLRSLPVIDSQRRLAGVIGPRELGGSGALAHELMAPAATTVPEAPALGLIAQFAGGHVHAVYVLDSERRLLGVVTEADWLAVLTRGLDIGAAGNPASHRHMAPTMPD
ncbi:HPP family protein [Ancylobacter sp. A5.8]|uniref:HPP family protein n=1 Tax=Ancylobacter gelatini TaxID=2919920 RepID=UPI001F4DD045|nr:HPP family protein [Ancylobacter gelatini]MCJ8142505.1 HPP family protein [Ancylobacter gelatini]